MGKCIKTIVNLTRTAAAATALVFLSGWLLVIGVYLFWSDEDKTSLATQQNKNDRVFHLSDSMVPGIYNYLANRPDSKRATTNTIGSLASHHLLAKDLISDVFEYSCIKGNARRILFISPDHFHTMRNFDRHIFALITDFNWQTPGEVLSGDGPLSTIKSEGVTILENPASIGQEHGIFALIPFAQRWCDIDTLTGVLLKPDEYQRSLDLGKLVATTTDSEPSLLVVVSSDFVHELPLSKATKVDAKNKTTILQIGDPRNELDFSTVVSDCPACLAFLHGYLSTRSSAVCDLQNQTSADYGGSKASVTSYFGATWQAKP